MGWGDQFNGLPNCFRPQSNGGRQRDTLLGPVAGRPVPSQRYLGFRWIDPNSGAAWICDGKRWILEGGPAAANYLVNGGCWMNQSCFASSPGANVFSFPIQPGTTTTMTSTADGYGLDQWKVACQTIATPCVRGDTLPQVVYNFTLNSTIYATTLTNMAGVVPGMSVVGTNIPANTTVTSVNPNGSITLSNAATGSGASTLTFTASAALKGQSRYFGVIQNNNTAAQKAAVYQPLDSVATQELLADSVFNNGGQLTFSVGLIDSSGIGVKVNIAVLQFTGTPDSIGAALYSAWSSVAGTDPTLSANWSVVGSKLGCTLTTSWQEFSVTVNAPTSAANLAVVMWSDAQLALASNTPSGPAGGWSWKETQLTPGGIAQPWRPLPTVEEKNRCRYFLCKTYDDDAGIASSAATFNGSLCITNAVTGANGCQVAFNYPVPMRADPTILLWSPNDGAANMAYDGTGAVDVAASSTNVGQGRCRLFVSAAVNAGHVVLYHSAADARL